MSQESPWIEWEQVLVLVQMRTVLWVSGVLAVSPILVMLLVLMLVLALALVIQRMVVLVVMQLPLYQKQTLRGRPRPAFRFLALMLTLP
jgi:hypothetical protein